MLPPITSMRQNNKIKFILLTFFALVLAGRGELETGTPECDEAYQQYRKILDKYPSIRKKQYEKLLSDYLKNARERYKQEKAASNLSGMGVAKEAIRILEAAQKEFEEKGDFGFPDRIRRQLTDFFEQIQKNKDEIDSRLQARKKSLRNSALSRFAQLAKKQDPDIGHRELMDEFEEWLKKSGGEERVKGEEKKEQKKKPSLSAADLGINIFTPEFKSLNAKLQSLSEKMAERRKTALKEFISKEEEEARKWYMKQRKLRNVKGMAVSGKAVNNLEDVASTLEEKGKLILPPNEDLRPELHEYMDELREKKKTLLAKFKEQEARLKAVGLEKFKELVSQEKKDIAPEQIAMVFKDWLAIDYSKARQAPDAGKPSKAAPPKADSLYFARKGQAQEWSTIGKWKANTVGMDIFQVPIYSNKDEQGSKRNVMGGGSAQWEYEHEKDLESNRFYAFRLKKLKGYGPVTVVEWPNLQNGWMLEVRTGRDGGKYGFEIQAGSAGGEGKPAGGIRLIAVDVQTEPKNGRVYVDGERYYVPGQDSLTPLTLNLKPGTYDIVLALEDHLKKRIENFRVREGKTINYDFKHESELPGQEIRVSPGKTWQRTKVEIKKGDKIWVVPEGKWTCGNKGEAVGPGGYSKSEYPHYYRGGEMRKTTKANYGALLMKVGEEYYGAPPDVEDKRAIPVPERKSVTANTWGELWFDINEKEGQQQRFDNRGTLKIKAVVLPQGKVPVDD